MCHLVARSYTSAARRSVPSSYSRPVKTIDCGWLLTNPQGRTTCGWPVRFVTSNSDASVYSGIGYIWQNRIGITSGTLTQRVSILDQKLGQACTNVKAAGITMYVVVLVDPTVDQSTVEACASSTDKLYMVTDTSQLTGVFSSIAGSIENLRIAK